MTAVKWGRRARSASSADPDTDGLVDPDALPGHLGQTHAPVGLQRSLRNLLDQYQLHVHPRPPGSIAVASALSGEGTTPVSQALARLLAAEFGASVCWIDGGWLDPVRQRTWDPSMVDLARMLRDQSALESAFRQAPDLPHLTSLRPGPVARANRHALAESDEFGQLLTILADEFDHVVLDIPPLLGNAEGLPLLRRSDAFLLVVRFRTASEGQIGRALDLARPVENLGVLLTDYRPAAPTSVTRWIRS